MIFLVGVKVSVVWAYGWFGAVFIVKFLLVHLYSYVPCEITSNIISSLKFSIELSANKYMYNSVDQALLY